MYKDPTDFRKRFQAYKDGKMPYKNGRPVKFEDGKDKYPITTGGAGYIPELDVVSAVKKAAHNYAFGDLPIDTIRQRLYENIQPAGYNDALRRVRRAVVENDPNDHADLDFIPTRPDRFAREYRDNIFAEYLQIPKEKRHNIASHKIIPSKYRPTKGDSPNNKYFKIDENTAWNPIWGRVYNAVYKYKNFFGTTKPLLINQNAIRPAIYDVLGKHTVGRGYDERGEYMSYADVWDLSPYGFGGEHDQSNGVGKPVHIYDRMYLDDYYGVKEPTHATYLPEVIVYGTKGKNAQIQRR